MRLKLLVASDNVRRSGPMSSPAVRSPPLRRTPTAGATVPRVIFLNLPVPHLARATPFYPGLGFPLNPESPSTDCSCLAVSDTIVVMLVVRDRFADFTAGPVADPHAGTAAI